MGVKASGGVRNHAQALALLQAGADRIGASSSIDVRQDSEKNATAEDSATGQKVTGNKSAY